MCPNRKSVWQWKRVRERLLVKWSDRLILVLILSKIIKSRSTHSQSKKYLISMWRVHSAGFCAFPITVQALLSSYKIVAAS
jgi:hypothetical protein